MRAGSSGASDGAEPLSAQEGLDLIAAVLPAGAVRHPGASASPSPIVLAVSGGPDSMAMLALAAENRSALAASGLAPHVVTVDHGLRESASIEAAAVAETAAGFGLPHRTLRWEGAKPRSNLQGEARAARYGLLVGAARAIGARTILTAHHQDDQVETHLIAAARRAGDRGLAGMRAAREIAPGLTLARPFLDVAGARLKATARDRGLRVFDDPSNLDGRFERARWRRALGEAPAERARILAALAEHALRRDEDDRRMAGTLEALLAEGRLTVDASGVVRLDADVPAELDADLAVDLLARLVRATSGAPYPPSRTSLVRLHGTLRRGPAAATLGGARVVAARPLRILREYGRSGPSSQAFTGDSGPVTFDGRFAASLDERTGGLPAVAGAAPLVSFRLVAFGAFGIGSEPERTLPVLVSEDNRILAVPPSLARKAPGAPPALRLAEQVTWRIAAGF